MSSKVDVWNMALGHLGVTTTIASPTENTKERKTMERYYEPTLEAVLRDRDWPFATGFKNPGLVTDFTTSDDPTNEWSYSYRYPTDCLRVRRIIGNEGRISANKIPFRTVSDDNGRLIYTDQEDAKIEYTRRITDPARFPPDFMLAISFRLAAYAAPALTRGDQMQLGKRAFQIYVAEFGLAAANAMNEEQVDRNQPDSEFIRERGG